MTNLEKRLADIQAQASRCGPDNQEPLVRSILEVARQLARLVSVHQFECGLDPDDPDPTKEHQTLFQISVDGAED